MDSAALDRALCERLGIEPIFAYWVVGDLNAHCFSGSEEECRDWYDTHREYAYQFDYCVQQRRNDPALSTTEAGFSILWKALKRNGWSVSLSDDADGC